MKRAALYGAIFVFGLVAGYLLDYVRALSQDHQLSAGSTVIGRAPQSVLFLSYSTVAMRLTAQRSREGTPFTVMATFADGRPAQFCRVSSDLAKQLPHFSKLVAKRQITFDQLDKQFPVQLGVLDIRDASTREVGEPMPVFINKAKDSIAFLMYGYATELTIPRTAFTTLERGCPGLAVK